MNIAFILVEPAVPENIGATARAINTMGFRDLRLVNPADHLHEDARKLAHGSVSVLENARLFSGLREALNDMDFVIGTTAKRRNIRDEYVPAGQLAELLTQKKGSIERCGIVFGREESGLTNEEIGLCDVLSTVPLAAPYPSINLAQAVMIYAFQLSEVNLAEKIPAPVKKAEYLRMKTSVSNLLPAIGISPGHPVYTRILERLALMDATDIHLMLSVLERLQPFIQTKENK